MAIWGARFDSTEEKAASLCLTVITLEFNLALRKMLWIVATLIKLVNSTELQEAAKRGDSSNEKRTVPNG